jgi:hypothetical protein
MTMTRAEVTVRALIGDASPQRHRSHPIGLTGSITSTAPSSSFGCACRYNVAREENVEFVQMIAFPEKDLLRAQARNIGSFASVQTGALLPIGSVALAARRSIRSAARPASHTSNRMASFRPVLWPI